MQEDAAGLTSSPLSRDLPQAVSAFVRGLIAAGYSPRTIDATVSDLAQFVAFLRRRGLERVDGLTRADVTALCRLPGGWVRRTLKRTRIVKPRYADESRAKQPPGRSHQHRPQALGSAEFLAFLRGKRFDRYKSGDGGRIAEDSSASSAGAHGRADEPTARRHEGQYAA